MEYGQAGKHGMTVDTYMNERFALLEEANLNSCDEIVQLQSKELRLSSNFDITSYLQLSLENLNSSVIFEFDENI